MNFKKFFLWSFFPFLALVYLLNSKSKNSLDNHNSHSQQAAISMNEFIGKYNDQTQVLDVRTPQEYQSGHVPGAVLLPLDQLITGKAVPFSKDSEIYVICRSGHRSLQATYFLMQNGYEKVHSVDGGTMEWIRQGKPIE